MLLELMGAAHNLICILITSGQWIPLEVLLAYGIIMPLIPTLSASHDRHVIINIDRQSPRFLIAFIMHI